MTTTVRRAASSDAELLHELARQTFALACPPGTTPEAIADFIAQHLSVHAFTAYLDDVERAILIGEVDGQPAGYVLFHSAEPNDSDVASALSARPTIELSKCYVLGGFHGAGVAAALVAAGVQQARDQGFAAVWLGVNQENARANRFYEKMGFQLVGSKKFLVGERWEDDYVRELVFDSRPAH
ncbi:GNAT family N-acetyltransferase [Salinibacterium sp. M195]|uniref:GNAT family N-acetyltransferase n=1 Tax=Salinibacterium sp. M195 TaxID=2583374 RepID=UPI001C627988|nr:GNAT family N-acetyltransferase [Salinibacterium sp. M195]QYH34523.1 GNAT family N-acetyltransferase [Salinibacterium sp. M195]